MNEQEMMLTSWQVKIEQERIQQAANRTNKGTHKLTSRDKQKSSAGNKINDKEVAFTSW